MVYAFILMVVAMFVGLAFWMYRVSLDDKPKKQEEPKEQENLLKQGDVLIMTTSRDNPFHETNNAILVNEVRPNMDGEQYARYVFGYLSKNTEGKQVMKTNSWSFSWTDKTDSLLEYNVYRYVGNINEGTICHQIRTE